MSQDSEHWEPELLESHLHGHDPEVEEYEIQPPVEKAKRGPKKLPLMWSRVISVSGDADEDIGVYNIEFDLLEQLTKPKPPPPRRGAEWEPIYQPTSYSKAHPDISMEAYTVGEKRLRSLGIEVSKLREDLRKVALLQARKEAHEQHQDIMEISRLARRISRGEFRDNAIEKQQLRPDFNQSVAINSRKRSKRRGPLTTSEKVDIVHRVLISYEKHAEIAKEYRVTPQVIAHLMMKAKKNQQFLLELIIERDEVANRRDVI
jgi:hypothetical protein